MRFQTDAQRDCYDNVALWMRELFGKYPCARQDFPGLGLFLNSALVEVLIYPWESDDAVINIRSFVVTGVEQTPDLFRFLLQENTKMRFGAFGIDEQGDILFEYSLPGSTCQKKELDVSVRAILETADDYDDRIVAQWGGKRALDRLQQVT